MLSVEDGAEGILEKALDQYEKYFSEEFPLYEHLNLTNGDGYSVSIAGAKRLTLFVIQCIEENEPVPIPSDYKHRIY